MIMKIVNLTQHAASKEQEQLGVFDLPVRFHKELTQLLTFETCPTFEQVKQRAWDIALLCESYGDYSDQNIQFAMIGGVPFLMSSLEKELFDIGVTPMYAFSERRSTERMNSEGQIEKVSQFFHAGWVISGGE